MFVQLSELESISGKWQIFQTFFDFLLFSTGSYQINIDCSRMPCNSASAGVHATPPSSDATPSGDSGAVVQKGRKRRTRVPERPDLPINLWSIMKNCIGKVRQTFLIFSFFGTFYEFMSSRSSQKSRCLSISPNQSQCCNVSLKTWNTRTSSRRAPNYQL